MLGYIALFIYVLFASIANIWGYSLVQIWPLPFLLIGAFAPSLIIIFLYNKFSSKPGKSHSIFQTNTLKDWIAINIVTAFCWISTFLALKELLPASFAALTCGFMPILVLPLNYYLRNEAPTKRQILAAIMIFIGLICIGYFEFQRISEDSYLGIGIGVFNSFITAITATLAIIISKRLNDQKIQSKEVYLHRFWLTLAFAFMFFIFRDIQLPQNYVFEIPKLVLLGIIGAAIPLFAVQYAIQKCGPIISSASVGAIPVTVLFLQYVTGIYREESITVFTGVFIVCLGIALISLPKNITLASLQKSN